MNRFMTMNRLKNQNWNQSNTKGHYDIYEKWKQEFIVSKVIISTSSDRYLEISIDLKNDNNSSLSCTKHNLARLYPYVILMNGFYANQIET